LARKIVARFAVLLRRLLGAIPVIFFSFSESKLPGYILPAIPSFSLLLAVAYKRLPNPGPKLHRDITIALALTWAAMGLSADS